jgi:membrane-associated protein
MELLADLWSLVTRIDVTLAEWAGSLGPWLYVVLAIIVFCETGLIVTPFLPGDSLLFAVGALAAMPGTPIHIGVVAALLIFAGILGDALNYAVGARLGSRLCRSHRAWLLNPRHLATAQRFYERHGGKTIILARFVPIVRTFAPFVAGMGQMRYGRFALFNVVGAVAWVLIFVGLGYTIGTLPAVQQNFQYVILAIVIVSAAPAALEVVKRRRGAQTAARPTHAARGRVVND